MANDIVNQVKVGSTTYDMKPYLKSATSGDSTTASSWTEVSNVIANTDSYDTVFNKVTTMVKNVRYLYNKLGTTNFSALGNTTSDALVALNNGKSNTDHTHSNYATTGHTHSNYSTTGHTHSNYSTTGHTHSNYASSTHNHDSAYAAKSHSHSEYSLTTHTHSNYSTTGHTHSDYSTTGHTHAYIATSNIVTTQTNSTSKVPAASLCYAMDQAYQADLTNVTNGKSSIASAITNQGVSTSATDTFATMASNIASIASVGGFGIASSTNVRYSDNSLIYENIPLSTYSIKLQKELKQIGILHSLEKREFPRFDVYTTDSIIFSLTSIKSRAVFLNEEILTDPIVNNSPLSISFIWEQKEDSKDYISPYHSIYRANLSKTENSEETENYEIEFEIEASKFNFTKSWEKNLEDDFYTGIGEINNEYICFRAKCLNDCPFEEEILLKIANSFLSSKKSEMNEVFNTKGVDAFYKSLPFEELVQKIYTQTSTSLCNENNIDLTLESMPEYYENSGFIFKRKGKLNDLNIGENFNFEENSSQRFNINIKLIQNIISENLFNIAYEQSNNPSTEYVLNVENLKKIMDVSSSYEDSSELKVFAEMESIVFKENDEISGYAIFDVNIISRTDLEYLLNFILKIEFKFEPTLLNNGLNFEFYYLKI